MFEYWPSGYPGEVELETIDERISKHKKATWKNFRNASFSTGVCAILTYADIGYISHLLNSPNPNFGDVVLLAIASTSLVGLVGFGLGGIVESGINIVDHVKEIFTYRNYERGLENKIDNQN